VKLNIDGAFAKGVAGIGIVLCDDKGAVMAAACRCLLNCRDATDAELMAMEEGLSMALLWTPLPVVIETDCSKVLVTRVNSTNVLGEGLRIGGVGRRMNSKVKSVKQGVY
jgi:ribonuclease HI